MNELAYLVLNQTDPTHGIPKQEGFWILDYCLATENPSTLILFIFFRAPPQSLTSVRTEKAWQSLAKASQWNWSSVSAKLIVLRLRIDHIGNALERRPRPYQVNAWDSGKRILIAREARLT